MKCISQYAKNEVTAGPKAKVDIEQILKENYGSKIYTLYLSGKEDDSFKRKLWYKLRKFVFSIKHFNGNEITIVQFPINNNKFFLKRLKNKIAFIHDLNGMRINDKHINDKEMNSLNTYNYIIAHNEKMKNYLIENGINKKKIYVLEIFDYLCEFIDSKHDINLNSLKIAYTGNLNKSDFIKELKKENMNFILNVYGNGDIKGVNNDNIVYKGKFMPDELPQKIEGDLGLVWDGKFDETDENVGFKKYTKYNNPHKLSCYIAAELPVIVWEKSAVADLVDKYDIGYKINNIYDINKIDFSNYNKKKNNVKDLAIKIRKGYFTKNAINNILKNYGNKWKQ